MKFNQKFSNRDGGNQERAAGEGFKFSVTRLSDSKVAFTNRRPRRDSKFWSYKFMVWDIKSNMVALPVA